MEVVVVESSPRGGRSVTALSLMVLRYVPSGGQGLGPGRIAYGFDIMGAAVGDASG